MDTDTDTDMDMDMDTAMDIWIRTLWTIQVCQVRVGYGYRYRYRITGRGTQVQIQIQIQVDPWVYPNLNLWLSLGRCELLMGTDSGTGKKYPRVTCAESHKNVESITGPQFNKNKATAALQFQITIIIWQKGLDTEAI